MAERFIQPGLREWAYQTSDSRTQAVQPWITAYNHGRPHSATRCSRA